MENPALRLVAPDNEMQTVRAGRKPNSELWTREYLTEAEVERLIKLRRLRITATVIADVGGLSEEHTFSGQCDANATEESHRIFCPTGRVSGLRAT